MDDKKFKLMCANHPDVEAVEKCQDCGRFFCRDCIMKIDGRFQCHLCHSLMENISETIGYEEKYNLKKFRLALGGCFVLVFLALLTAIASIVIPFLRLTSERRCMGQLRQVYQVLTTYAEDNGGMLSPDNNDLRPLFNPKYSKGYDLMQLLRCPGTKNDVEVPDDLKDDSKSTIGAGMSYFYQGGLRISDDENEKIPLLWDQSPENHKGKGNCILYTNGVVTFTDKEFPVLKVREKKEEPAEEKEEGNKEEQEEQKEQIPEGDEDAPAGPE